MEPSIITMYSVRLLIVSILLQAYTSRCCLERERVALLQLKSYFMSLSTSAEFSKYLSSELSSWDGEGNCCLWKRVTCNKSMQHVTVLSLSELMDIRQGMSNGNYIENYNVLNVSLFHPFRDLISLDLSANYINRLVGNGGYKMLNLPRLETLNFGYNGLHEKQEIGDLVGSLNSLKELFLLYNNMGGNSPGQELTHLKQLRILDISENGSYGDLSSQDLCKLRSLEELRLNWNQPSGILPPCIWNLTSLRVLDLSHNRFSGNLPATINLTASLRVLDLSDNSFSGNLPPTINLPLLEWLSISNNNFQGRFSLSYLMNHSRLQGLSLSNNALQVQLDDDSAYSLSYSTSKLVALGLSHCNLIGQSKILHKFLSYQSNLEYIDLSSNGLFGLFPAWLLQNNLNLLHLNMGNNSFIGSLDLPKHNNLLSLDISSNKLIGTMPKDFGIVLSSLVVLNMSFNSFDGHIPTSVGNMTQLASLDLSNNNFFGEVPRRLLSDLAQLKHLSLSKNNLRGEIIPIYMNLSSLDALYLNDNDFGGTMQGSLRISQQLSLLDISDNEATGEIPTWIGDFENLNSMSLARNEFRGEIPSQLCKLEGLGFLDLSENRFTGGIPPCVGPTRLRFLHMHGNHLTGVIPKGLATLSSLETLDLSNNQLSGGIPEWIYKLSQLGIILLGGNQLEGELPVQLCRLQHVNIIDLSNNSISGAIPSCFQNMSFGGQKLEDFLMHESWDSQLIFTKESYVLSWDFPEYEINLHYEIQEEVNFMVKSRYSSYKGNILTIMSELDLSSNKLIGDIPPEMGELGRLHALNLSHNHLSGSIPRSFSKLKSVESLDLSSNNLSGAIPSELVALTSLEIFNVSYNNLSGEVPETGQFGTFDERNYRGNPLLCGSWLPTGCGMDEPAVPNTGNTSIKEGDEAFDMEVFLWSFGMSSITILIAFIVVLAINPHWRRAWFAFLDVRFLWWFNP